jgi:uncharacterized lipoprotein YmbA
MKRLIVMAAMVLTGCGNAPALPPAYVEVKVPVPVPCQTAPVSVPAFAVDQLKIGATIDVQMRALRAERHQRIGYERELLAANEVCRK